MKKKRISMDKIREILRLSHELNLGCRKIAAALNISKTAVSQYISEFRAYGIDYQSICSLADSELSELLSSEKKKCKSMKPLNHIFAILQKNLKEKELLLRLYGRNTQKPIQMDIATRELHGTTEYGSKQAMLPCILNIKQLIRCLLILQGRNFK